MALWKSETKTRHVVLWYWACMTTIRMDPLSVGSSERA